MRLAIRDFVPKLWSKVTLGHMSAPDLQAGRIGRRDHFQLTGQAVAGHALFLQLQVVQKRQVVIRVMVAI